MVTCLVWTYSRWLLLVLVLLFCLSCVTPTPYENSRIEVPINERSVTEEKPGLHLKEPKQPPEEDRSSSSGAEATPTASDTTTGSSHETNQELLDSALDFIQASNDFWEAGDLDNALDALDKAYSLILKVNQDTNPEVLQQKEDLRFTISKRIIEVYSSRFTVVNGYHKAIPLEMNVHVERALKLFKGRERNFFLGSYRRSGRYRPDIVKALKEAGLPEELSWLPLIESGFKVRAMSRARALGLWQFIASTGYKFGLKRNQWIDERMDPEKSTKAAIAYLKELHQIFGDWTTVLAAYNCGERRVLNRIRSQRINYLDNFWDLYQKLPSETAFYVPRFLAVLHIINNPERHGIILPPLDEPFAVEEVTINKQVHLKTIAKRLEIDYGLLKTLNTELRHYTTPNNPYSLKVPFGKGELLLAKLDDIPVWRPPLASYSVHKVRRGESLSIIAARYKTSVSRIMAANGLKRRDYLKVGWRLKIPLKGGSIVYQKRPPVLTSKPKEREFEYVVKRGDSLWTIAQRFHTTTEVIRSYNRLNSTTLRIGQVLKIPKGRVASRSSKTRTYRVRKGDSPYLIAKRHRMNLSAFLRLNHLTPRSTIFPGQNVLVKNE